MLNDVQQAISVRGPLLAAHAKTLDLLHALLADENLGSDKPARNRGLQLLHQALIDLRDPAAAVAAFQDLADAVNSVASSHRAVEGLTSVLAAVLETAGRTLRSEGWTLTSVLQDSAFEIGWIRNELDALPAPDKYDRSVSGLSVEDRIALCRRLLGRVDQPGDHVIWLVYGDARVGWRVDFGHITFFDGQELLQVLEHDDLTTWQDGSGRKLPPELLEDRPRDGSWPAESLERWAAVRVDLGSGPYSDPISTARKQADALVRLAGFQGQGTSWQLFTGARHFVDQTDRNLLSWFQAPEAEIRDLRDRTADELEELSKHLIPHLPIQDPGLDELLEAAGLFDKDPEQPDPLEVLMSVRVIELLASRCGLIWQKHLKTTFSIGWARRRVLDEIYEAVSKAVTPTLGEAVVPGLPRPEDIFTFVRADGFRINHDVALAAVSSVLQQLPRHHLAARRVRDLQRRTSTPQALQDWLDELRREYTQIVNRLARCRNALSHGGPVNREMIATVTAFARAHAKTTTSIGLWATVAGDPVKQAHDQRRSDDEAWLASIASAGSITAALFPPQQSGSTP
jgi:hypothetical protein